jgi:hypothetical protein
LGGQDERAGEGLDEMGLTSKDCYRRYNRSAKGQARRRRYNRTRRRLEAQRARNQVRRERAMHREIVALATGR